MEICHTWKEHMQVLPLCNNSSCSWDACGLSFNLFPILDMAWVTTLMPTSLSVCRPMDSSDRSDTSLLETDLLGGDVPVQQCSAGEYQICAQRQECMYASCY
jgi:hypothetical protein